MATIIPQYKLIMTYDIQPRKQTEYTQYVMSTFVPSMQAMQVYLLGVYHTLHGDYPSRQAEFVSDSLETMVTTLESRRFGELETTLETYIHNYNRKVVRYRRGFQF